MFDPIQASNNIRDEFISYISTSFHLADQSYARQFAEALGKEGAISKGPYLDISDAFESGKSINTLIYENEMSPLFQELEPGVQEGDKEIKLVRGLYKHQEKAIRKINADKNIVVTTGTGSGKTECFILPIINHLLREKEAGTLGDGVRAILIYPMNALANDQMKRLRLIFKMYPDITFGVYNSSTQQEESKGIAEYGRVFKDGDGRPLKPLKNEVISRKTMQTRPPHILVTNYAMLEYMMLRPNDDLVFSGSKLSFIVLDEAHIYRGATGIETSLLLRRLKARISNPGEVHHILTSATLGGKEADDDIVSFAGTLCDARFDTDDIIRSTTVMPELPEVSKDIPLELFEHLANPDTSMDTILKQYDITMDSSQSDSEILYDLCVSSKVYKILRECAIKPMTVHEIASSMRKYMELKDIDLVNFIHVASKAEKNKTALIKARYHMFVRALEGAYITLNPDKKLYLTRKNYDEIGGESWKVFEAAACDDCGRIAVAGKTINNHLESAANRYDEAMEVYLLRLQGEELDVEEDNDAEDENEIGKEDYVLCAKCGEIHHESQKLDFSCGHGEESLVRVKKAERKGTKNENKCPCCNLGHMKLFYIGYDAATAVLGTELFEQLPESEKVLETKKTPVTETNNLFAMATASKAKADIVKRKRQFLAFSDSRSEAAFYACYMTSFYQEFLRRRGIWQVIEKNRDNISKRPWEISTLVQELASYFDSNRTFADPGDVGTENLTATSKRQAWIAVLNEMVNARRSTSLVSLGILDFVYKGNSEEMMVAVGNKYGQAASDVNALFNLLVMDIVYNGALEGEGLTLTNDEREYIYYAAQPRRFKKCKNNVKDREKNYVNGWIPRVRESGRIFKNGRVNRLVTMLNISEDEARELLSMYWDGVLVNGTYGLTQGGDEEYFFSTDKFMVVVGDENRPIYQCEKCGKTTMVNCKNRCTILKCNGQLKEISHQTLIDSNHYARLYAEKLMSPLHIKEHTAQLGRAEQQKYQEMFVNKEINALSCSTTFEMGVDVGDLETVYLRNMPPSPANYVQRAGRAGRSLHSAAYSLTYSKLSSHDFTYFEDPARMISGQIGVPLFSISNEKVILRHIFAVALSDFFARNQEVYNSNNADILLNQDGYERLKNYLIEKPERLKNILLKSIPDSMHMAMGIEDWSWMDKLVGADGVLNIAVVDFRETVDWYEKEFIRLKRQGDIQAAAQCERQLKEFRRSGEDGRGRNELIEFLVRYNVLPKYGFPVDTVELYQGMDFNQDKKLQMVRDLQLAIAEYAPDAQVVADGKLYTSRYIRKLPQATGQDWREVYIAQCGNQSCMTWNYKEVKPSKNVDEYCVSCGNPIEKKHWRNAIEPRKGFIAEAKSKDVPLRKPERSYRSDDYYIGDITRKVMYKKTFLILDTEKLQMETSANDSLMVVCNDHFYVCEQCGYAISSTSGKEAKDFNSFAIEYNKDHKSPWGRECNRVLRRKDLCHSFKTDVVRITFGTSRANNQSTMLSVMYALLEAVSSVLDIERTDIKGCLHKVRFKHSLIYEIVLYDAVAGGAGHVRRLVTDDCGVFQKVINKAITLTKGCSCNPSCYNCLRNYYNQAIHDKLNRIEAYYFLEHYYGQTVMIPDEQFDE
jgi:DEAD/DEAH box helicase domain protein